MTTIMSQEFKLTKHGRQRYRSRVQEIDNDTEIIADCLFGECKHRVIWKPERNYITGEITHWRLVTVLPVNIAS